MESQNQKELRELLAFGFDTFEAFQTSLADDGRITRKDLPNFFTPGLSVTAAFDKLGNPVKRWNGLSKTEKFDLITFAASRFDLPDDQLEDLIEDTLREVAGDIRLVLKWQEYIKNGNETASA